MRHRKKKFQMNKETDHRNALLKNLTTSIILYERVQTTRRRAKSVQPIVEKVITIAKNESAREAIRKFKTMLFDENASKKLLEVLKARYADRTSGFTRITAIGARPGDRAPKVQIELL